MTIWFDMTNSLEVREGGVVGVIKAELEIAKNLKALHPELRISRFDGEDFVEVPESELGWLWSAGSVGDAWLDWKRARLSEGSVGRAIREVLNPESRGAFGLAYRAARAARSTLRRSPRPEPEDAESFGAAPVPFGDDDLVLSYGWMGSGKEFAWQRVSAAARVTLVYMVYDLAMVRPEIQAFYRREGVRGFEHYLEWVSRNSTYLLFGGATAQVDARRWQEERGLPVVVGDWVAHGSEVASAGAITDDDRAQVYARYGITSPFVLAVGSIDPKKNYEILYRAYRIAQDDALDLPQLVIAGGMHGDSGLARTMLADPELEGKLVIASPSDRELEILYADAEFTLLPTMYEGWSLVLPEALSQGKFVLASDVEPLREISGDLIDYVAPDDPRAWAEAILRLHDDPAELAARSERVRREWRGTTWRESAERVRDLIVTWEAEAAELRRADPLAARGVEEPYVLVLGPVDDKANPETALRAMVKLRERSEGTPQFVFNGPAGILSYGYLPRRSEDPRLPDGSVAVLNDASLTARLVQGAQVVLVTDPDGADGIAAALEADRDVIAADTPRNRAVVGDVEYVDALDVYGWADRIESILAVHAAKETR